LGGRGRWISEFDASLIYRVSYRTARATQRNPVSKKPKQKTKNKNKNKKMKQKKNKEKLKIIHFKNVWFIVYSELLFCFLHSSTDNS
jgi:murein tripeptide amidase MpaA